MSMLGRLEPKQTAVLRWPRKQCREHGMWAAPAVHDRISKPRVKKGSAAGTYCTMDD